MTVRARPEVCAWKDGYSPDEGNYVILWNDSCILGLSAILWRCSPTVYNIGIH